MLKKIDQRQPNGAAQTIRMTPQVLKQYKESIAANEPETFALLGGSLDEPFLITDFYFLPPKMDAGGGYVASGSFVYPDHMMLNYIIDRVLTRNGRYMIGLWHSHPGRFSMPSHQDLAYCSQIIANDDSPGRRWQHFLAPITTFDDQGRDEITGWTLPKGGSAFRAAEVITYSRSGKYVPTHEAEPIDCASQNDGCSRPRRNTSLPQFTDVDAEFLRLAEKVEADLAPGATELTYIEKYHTRRKLAEVRLKLRYR